MPHMTSSSIRRPRRATRTDARSPTRYHRLDLDVVGLWIEETERIGNRFNLLSVSHDRSEGHGGDESASTFAARRDVCRGASLRHARWTKRGMTTLCHRFRRPLAGCLRGCRAMAAGAITSLPGRRQREELPLRE